jgi:hypothetical protein
VRRTDVAHVDGAANPAVGDMGSGARIRAAWWVLVVGAEAHANPRDRASEQ